MDQFEGVYCFSRFHALRSLTTKFSYLKQVFDLALNGFTGKVPQELSSISTLEKIFCDVNMFTGSVPDLTSQPNFLRLILSNNMLTGQLSHSIWNLFTLEELAVSDNYLNGTISNFISGEVIDIRLNLYEFISTLSCPLQIFMSLYILTWITMLFRGLFRTIWSCCPT